MSTLVVESNNLLNYSAFVAPSNNYYKEPNQNQNENQNQNQNQNQQQQQNQHQHQKKYLNMMILASKYNHIDTFKRLAELNIDFNQKDKTGCTPLMYASQKGYTSLVQYLIQYGADVNASNNFGLTALMYASRNGHGSIVSYLISQGANVNQVDHEGSTALFYANTSRNLEISQYLVSHGANPFMMNNNKNNCTVSKLASDNHCEDTTDNSLHHTNFNLNIIKSSIISENEDEDEDENEEDDEEEEEEEENKVDSCFNMCIQTQTKPQEKNNDILKHQTNRPRKIRRGGHRPVHEDILNIFGEAPNFKKLNQAQKYLNFDAYRKGSPTDSPFPSPEVNEEDENPFSSDSGYNLHVILEEYKSSYKANMKKFKLKDKKKVNTKLSKMMTYLRI